MVSKAEALALASGLNPGWGEGKDWDRAGDLLRDDEEVIGGIAAHRVEGVSMPTYFTGFITTQRIILFRRRSIGGKGVWEAQLSEIHTVRHEREGGMPKMDITVIQTVDGGDLVLDNHDVGALVAPYDQGDFARSMTRLLRGEGSAEPDAKVQATATVGDQLAQVAALHEQGILSDDEYAEAKRRLIEGI